MLRIEVGAVPDGQDTVVDGTGLAAGFVGQDARLVELENELVRLDGDADGLHGDRRQQRLLVAGRDVDERLNDAAGDVGAVRQALLLLLGLVRVLLLGAQTAALLVEPARTEKAMLESTRQEKKIRKSARPTQQRRPIFILRYSIRLYGALFRNTLT